MSEVKHYGTTDLYDPDRPVEEVSASAKVDPVTLGRNVRAWMRNRVRNKTSNDTVLEIDIMNHPKPEDISTPSPNSIDSSIASLTNLPGEIRNNIYSFTLFPHHDCLLALSYSHPRDIFRTLLHSPIFRVSRQIRAEALSFLSATKDFRIPGVRTSTTFFRYLGPVGRANLTNVTIAFLSDKDLNLDGGKDLIRLMRDIRGLGKRRFRVGIQGHVKMEECAWAFLEQMKLALEEGCEEMEIVWCMLANSVPDSSKPALEKTTKRMEEVFGKDNKVEGNVLMFVNAENV